MKKAYLTLALICSAIVLSNAQNCQVYIPGEVGTVVEIYNYDGKDKLTGITKQQLQDIKTSGDTTLYFLSLTNLDKKGENPVTQEFTYKCYNDVFYIDMQSFVNQEQMGAYENMEMEVHVDEVNIPSKVSAGQRLDDGSITIKILGLPIAMTMKVEVRNRMVNAIEDIDTPAGTFNCVAMSEDVSTAAMGMNMTFNTKTWYSANVGVVKTESYRKGKLFARSVVNSVTK